MKRLVYSKIMNDLVPDIDKKNSGTQVFYFDIEFIISLPEYLIEDCEIVAATHKGFYVPEGDVPPSVKDKIMTSQAMQDYQDFIQSVESLITQHYDMHIYYKHSSPTNSYYYGILAKDKTGNLLFDFNLNVRISTHEAHRTDQSEKQKKNQENSLAAEKNRALGKINHRKRTAITNAGVIVNDEYFDDYMDAFLVIDETIEKKFEIMTRRANQEKKKKKKKKK